MENNILITQLSSFANCSSEEASLSIKSVVEWMADVIVDKGELVISGFGKFQVEKHPEYIQVDSSTNKRVLIPPSLTLEYKADPLLSEEDKNNAVSFSSIANLLAKKLNQQPLKAEKVAVGFFKLMLLLMDEGKSVNVDGLGEFTLTKVRVDEKVYGKVTYVADKILSEKINRPFSYFYPVTLNDGVEFDDIETKALDAFVKPFKNDSTFLISDSSKESESIENDQDEAGDEVTENNADALPPSSQENVVEEKTAAEEKTSESQVSSNIDDEIIDDKTSVPVVESATHNGTKKFVIASAVLALCIAGGVMLYSNKSKDNASTLPTDTLSSQYAEDTPSDSGLDKEKSLSSSANEAETDSASKYSELNAKIPFGAYDIVGVQAEITAPAGMDMATIARLYMGADNPVYLVIMNNGVTNPEPGAKIIIPKLRERPRK